MVIALFVVAAVIATPLAGSLYATMLFAVTAAILLMHILDLQRALAGSRRRIAAATERLAHFEGSTLEESIDALHGKLSDVAHRLSEEHPVSGLPMRETLLARIETDGRGMLGAIEFSDYDHLSTFDPKLAEQVFAELVIRLRRMMPATRLLAQVDRAQVAIWFGDSSAAERNESELEALSYALGDTISVGGRDILPKIRTRLADFGENGDSDAAEFVLRTLAAFALDETTTLVGQDRPDPAVVARERYDMEQDLRQAIARRELQLVFQPLIDAGQGRISGAEALLRWDHPGRGLVSPAQFIPLMEAIGLADEIGSWVLNAAAREARNWQVRGLTDLRIAVNVSGHQLDRDDLPTVVERTLDRHALPATALEIELTESVATSDADRCRRIFQQLRAMGVRLAVDDFGTGYSGFSSLRALAFDKIKIDREFVTRVDTRGDSQAICQSIIALARGLGIRVLAEGVERREEYVWLRRHGCHHFQGYYFARPLDSARFVEFATTPQRLTPLLSLDPLVPVLVEQRFANLNKGLRA